MSLLTIITIASSVYAVMPRQVLADHDACYGLDTLLDDINQCKEQKRDIVNRTCYASYESNNTKIAECVKETNAHFDAPVDTAPSLPSGGQPSSFANLKGDCKADKIDKTNCGIIGYLVTLINVLSAVVGIVIVIMITVGGIQYSTARDNPQAVAAAKGRITNAVMALFFFLFTYAFLQYIVPGGVL